MPLDSGGFNPRARVGRDVLGTVTGAPGSIGFNPRARVGRDHADAIFYYTYPCFNPRARVGRDSALGYADVVEVGVSIHAPAWGATA